MFRKIQVHTWLKIPDRKDVHFEVGEACAGQMLYFLPASRWTYHESAWNKVDRRTRELLAVGGSVQTM